MYDLIMPWEINNTSWGSVTYVGLQLNDLTYIWHRFTNFRIITQSWCSLILIVKIFLHELRSQFACIYIWIHQNFYFMSMFDSLRSTHIMSLSISVPSSFLAADLIVKWMQTDGAGREVEAWLPSSTSKSRQHYFLFTWQE